MEEQIGSRVAPTDRSFVAFQDKMAKAHCILPRGFPVFVCLFNFFID